jgi:hypothetical protein
MKKILIINNRNNRGYIENVIKPLIRLQETCSRKFYLDIKDIFYHNPTEFDKYDYVIFNLHLFINEETWYDDTIRHLSLGIKTKFICYIDEWWQLPKSHPLYALLSINHLSIAQIIKKCDAILTYGNEALGNEIKKLNKNIIHLKRTDGYENIASDIKQPVFGVVPTEYDMENIKQLSTINLCGDKFWKHNKIVLVGFTNMKSVYNNTDKCYMNVPCTDNIWMNYERIITDNYKICSEEYKEFLLKFLPNDQYKGDISGEPYKRIWKNEIKSDTVYYNILLNPLVKNKYNHLSYNIEVDMAKNTVINGKYVQVLNTVEFPKNNMDKSIRKTMMEMAMEYRQEIIFPVDKKSNIHTYRTLIQYLKP